MKRLKLTLSLIIAVIMMAMCPLTIWADITPTAPANGSGTENDPYQISTNEELYWFANQINNEDEFSINGILTADITVNAGSFDADGSWSEDGTPVSWTPFSFFMGTFDGNGHTISGLYVNGSDKTAFCGSLNSGTIKNLGIVNSYFNCGNRGAALCGQNNAGTITACYVSSSTIKGNYWIGCICGQNIGTITSCYSTGTATGNNFVGSICGQNASSVSNCYSTQSVGNGGGSQATEAQFASGEVTYLLNGSTSTGTLSWYQNLSMTGDSYPVLVYNGSNIVEKSDNGTYKNVSVHVHTMVETEAVAVTATAHGNNEYWTCSGCNLVFADAEGTIETTVEEQTIHNYPDDFTEGFKICSVCKDAIYEEPAMGVDGYYEIENAGQLYWFADKVNNEYSEYSTANARLTSDIVVNDGTFSADGKFTATGATEISTPMSWTPIRGQEITDGQYRESQLYSGTFDGDGHTVSGLYWNRNENYVGLFGAISGTVKNVGLVNSYIGSSSYVGGICGVNYGGTITNCYSTCNINGSSDVGGICGCSYENASISYCYVTGNVMGNMENVGGICGNSDYSSINNCYATGNVSAINSKCGGVCGMNGWGTISNCYASGEITCDTYGAGICGYNNYDGIIKNCYTSSTGLTGIQYGSTEDSEDGVDFSTGRICYLLNGSTSEGTLTWYQKLGTNGDVSPVFASTGDNTVYFGYADCTATEKSVYSNDADCEIQGHFGNNGYCARCGEELPTAKNFVLTDGETYNRTTQCIATTLDYTRNYTGNWQALYVPFALDVDALKADYDIAYIIGVRQEDTDNDGTIDYQCMDVGYMPSGSKTKANYPYLIRKKTAEDDATITLSDATIEPAASKSVVCSTILNNYTITGYYAETAADAMNGKYGMDNDGSLCPCDGTSALKPQRWAMAVESRGDSPYTIVGGAGAKSIMIHVIGEDDDTATGIISVEYDQSSTANCYNIAGQRVKSNAKGLVIKNGKKYLNK